MSVRRRLLAIYDGIAARSSTTTDAHPAWPCRRGCDACCRSLADVPRMTRAEWELLREGLDALPAAVRAEVDARIAALAHATRPIVCPMLDEKEGACLVYAHRPAMCRTYGFYVRRQDGIHCAIVERQAPDDVVWGNQESVDDALAGLSGAEVSLLELSSPSSAM